MVDIVDRASKLRISDFSYSNFSYHPVHSVLNIFVKVSRNFINDSFRLSFAYLFTNSPNVLALFIKLFAVSLLNAPRVTVNYGTLTIQKSFVLYWANKTLFVRRKCVTIFLFFRAISTSQRKSAFANENFTTIATLFFFILFHNSYSTPREMKKVYR